MYKKGLMILALAVAACGFHAGAGRAQSDQWNALYDRIIRLEHEVRGLRGVPSRGGGASEQRLRALEAEVNALRRQVGARLNGFEARLRRLENGRTGWAGPSAPAAPRLRQPGARFDAPEMTAEDLYAPAKPEVSVEYETPRARRQPPRPPVAAAPPRPAPAPPVSGARSLPGSPPAATAGMPPLTPGAVSAAPLDAPGAASSGQAVGGASADVLLKRARDSFLTRRFGMAEASYRAFLGRFGAHRKAPQAQFELGETYYVQGRYKPAGQAYLETYKRWPRSSLAPQALLRLGMTLKRLGQGKQACRTWKLLRGKYPSSRAARKSAPREMKRAKCRG